MSEGGASPGEIAADGYSSRELALAGLASLAVIGVSMLVAPGLTGVAGSTLAVIMLAITVTDWRSMIIPDQLVLLSAAIGLVALKLESSGDFVDRIINAAIRSTAMAALFLSFRLCYRWVRGREGMGLGDIKLAGVAGLWLQASTLPIAFEIAALIGLAVALIHQWRSGARFDPLVKLPFGAFLAPAIWLCWLLEHW